MRKIYLLLLFTFIFRLIATGQSSPILIPFLSGEKWGYADTNGHIVIKPKWERADFFYHGRADVYINDTHCYINTKGHYIIPPSRHLNGPIFFSWKDAHFNTVNKKGKHGIIDSDNHTIIPCMYEVAAINKYPTAISGSFGWDKRHPYTASVRKNGKYGIIDTLNNAIIPFQYDAILGDQHNTPVNYYVVYNDYKYGLIDIHNRIIIPIIYTDIQFDDHYGNLILLSDNNRRMIVDTSYKTVFETPDYSICSISDSLIFIADKDGKRGAMNYDKQIVIPCIYNSIYKERDSIIVVRYVKDSVKITEHYMQYINRNTFKPTTPWQTYNQFYYHFTFDTAYLPTHHQLLFKEKKLRIAGRDIVEYKKGNYIWASNQNAKYPEVLYPVRGAAIGDTTINYAAVIDTNGNYIIPPQKTKNTISVLNTADSLLLVTTNDKDSLCAVSDYHLHPILDFQKYGITMAFYYNNIFYAIARKKDYDHVSYGYGYRYDYNHFLITASGKTAKGLEDYKLHWYTDSFGLWLGKRDGMDVPQEDWFNSQFKGYFLAENKSGRRGIISINGNVVFPEVSFNYTGFSPEAPNMYLVSNPTDNDNSKNEHLHYNHKTGRYTGYIDVSKGMPYLVNANNKVLLDSLSISYVGDISHMHEYNYPLYDIVLDHPNSGGYISFYMDYKGRGYFRKLRYRIK